jgi:hypothetical protein
VVVAGEFLEWETVLGVLGDFSFFTITTFKLPDHDTLVSGTSDEDIRGFTFLCWDSWGNGCDPSIVTLKDTLENEFGFSGFAFRDHL